MPQGYLMANSETSWNRGEIPHRGAQGVHFETSPSSSTSTAKKQISFDEKPKVHLVVERKEAPVYSIRNFIYEEERLNKPVLNLAKIPGRSILRKPVLSAEENQHDHGNDVVEPRTFEEKSSLFTATDRLESCNNCAVIVNSTGSSSLVADLDGLQLSTYLADGNCGCDLPWLNYLRDKPKPQDVHSESTVTEVVFFTSHHKHNIGTSNEFEVWRGFTCNSFTGFIDIIPSTYIVPIRVKLGDMVAVSLLKIKTKEPPYLKRLMIKHETKWCYHTDNTIQYRVKKKGHHEWVQVQTELCRSADSGTTLLATHFGKVFVPKELLVEYDPFPKDTVYSQFFMAVIEPLAAPLKYRRQLDDEVVHWKAVSIKLHSATYLDEHYSMVQRSSIMSTVEWGSNKSNKPSLREMTKIKKRPRDNERLKAEALKVNQILVPRSERIEDIREYISYLENRQDVPDFVVEEVILPCTILLDGDQRPGQKIRQAIKILAEIFLVNEPGRSFMEELDYRDTLKRKLVYLFKVNLSFMHFKDLEEMEGKYRHFVSFNDVSSDSEENSS